ncbi:MAG: ATP-binding cassette domain-containing protein [Lachnospiraceae bacterium]
MVKMMDVSKQLGGFQLGPISFELPAGYICGLVGQNGAGKTTLLHLLLGLYRVKEGQIEIDGMTYAKNEKEIHDKIGTVLVEDLFEGTDSLKANANRFGSYYSRYRWERMQQYLKLFHLEERAKFGKLSKGQKLKCQFAFALACDPKLLILDEPTGNFDPDFRDQFFHILQEFIKDGTKSVILATHLTEDLDRVADYLIYLEEGTQNFAGDMEEFRSQYRIVSGESYKIKQIGQDKLIHMEEKKYGAKALVRHRQYSRYDEALQVTEPTIEEFMYFFSKRKER